VRRVASGMSRLSISGGEMASATAAAPTTHRAALSNPAKLNPASCPRPPAHPPHREPERG